MKIPYGYLGAATVFLIVFLVTVFCLLIPFVHAEVLSEYSDSVCAGGACVANITTFPRYMTADNGSWVSRVFLNVTQNNSGIWFQTTQCTLVFPLPFTWYSIDDRKLEFGFNITFLSTSIGTNQKLVLQPKSDCKLVVGREGIYFGDYLLNVSDMAVSKESFNSSVSISADASVSMTFNSSKVQTVTFDPTVSNVSASADITYTETFVAPPQDKTHRAFIKFPTTGIPNTATIVNASLWLNKFLNGPDYTTSSVYVYNVTTDWNESGSTTSIGELDFQSTGNYTSVSTVDQWYFWNVTTAFLWAYYNNLNLSLMLNSTKPTSSPTSFDIANATPLAIGHRVLTISNESAYFHSREEATPPVLQVYYNSLQELWACGSISTAGYYQIKRDLNDSGNCLTISSSNVQIDGNNHKVDCMSSQCVYIANPYSNITLTRIKLNMTNSTASNTYNMYVLGAVTNGNIFNNTFDGYRTGGYNIRVYTGSNNLSIFNNNLFEAGGGSGASASISLRSSNDIYVFNNNITTNAFSSDGIEFDGSSTLRVYNSSIYNNLITVLGSTSTGILLKNGYWNQVYNNNISSASVTAAYGIFVSDSFNNSLWNNTIVSNQSRIYLKNSTWNTIENSSLFESTTTSNYDVFITNASQNNYFINMTSINWGDVWFAPNQSARNETNITVQQYERVNVSDWDTHAGINGANATVLDQDLNSVQSVLATDGLTEWAKYTVWFGNNTVNTTEVPLNFSAWATGYDGNASNSYDLGNESGTFVVYLVASGGGGDTTPPYWLLNSTDPASPTTFTVIQAYFLNATWADDTAVSIVRLEFNGVNYSNDSGYNATIYAFRFDNLAAGNYLYKWFANDSSDNANATPFLWLNITKGAVESMIRLNNSASDFNTVYPKKTINSSASCNASTVQAELGRNGSALASGTPGTELVTDYGAGFWSFTANCSGNENYSSTSNATPLYLLVNQGGLSSVLTINGTSDNVTSLNSTFNVTVTANVTTACWMNRNDSFLQQGNSPLSNLTLYGNFTQYWYFQGTCGDSNYSNSTSEAYWLNIITNIPVYPPGNVTTGRIKRYFIIIFD